MGMRGENEDFSFHLISSWFRLVGVAMGAWFGLLQESSTFSLGKGGKVMKQPAWWEIIKLRGS